LPAIERLQWQSVTVDAGADYPIAVETKSLRRAHPRHRRFYLASPAKLAVLRRFAFNTPVPSTTSCAESMSPETTTHGAYPPSLDH